MTMTTLQKTSEQFRVVDQVNTVKQQSSERSPKACAWRESLRSATKRAQHSNEGPLDRIGEGSGDRKEDTDV